MQVLKFGGSSVANAENIHRVIAIIKHNANRKAVVVSALGGITDLLLNCVAMAEVGNENYKTRLSEIEDRHMEVLEDCISRRLGFRPANKSLRIEASCEELRAKGACRNQKEKH